MILSGISIEDWDVWYDKVERVLDASMIDEKIFDTDLFIGEGQAESVASDLIIFLQKIIIICNNYPEIPKKIFDSKSKVTAENLYQLTYLLAINQLCEQKQYKELLTITSQLLSAITPETIIDDSMFQGVSCQPMTEYEVYEILTYIPTPVMFKLLNAIDAPRSAIQELKRDVVKKNEESFVQHALNVTFDNIFPELYSLTVLLSLKELIPIAQACLDERFGEVVEVKTPIIKDNIQIQRICSIIQCDTQTLNDFAQNFPPDYLYSLLKRDIYLLINTISVLSVSCPNYTLVRKIKDIVESNSWMARIKKHYHTKQSLLELLDSEFSIPALDEFKRKYLDDLSIPASVGKQRDERQRFSGNRIWDTPKMKKLYHALVENGFVNWDAATYFSFMYRMCSDYTPSQEDTARMLTRIVWAGKVRELLALVYYLHEGDTRIWKKCETFFVDPKGNEFIFSRGCKNMATPLTDRLERILKDKSFR